MVAVLRELRSEAQCFAMAEEMDGRAEVCGSTAPGAEFLYMAKCWRVLAAQAAWQDAAEGQPTVLARNRLFHAERAMARDIIKR
jgi:hypothetical protein